MIVDPTSSAVPLVIDPLTERSLPKPLTIPITWPPRLERKPPPSYVRTVNLLAAEDSRHAYEREMLINRSGREARAPCRGGTLLALGEHFRWAVTGVRVLVDQLRHRRDAHDEPSAASLKKERRPSQIGR